VCVCLFFILNLSYGQEQNLSYNYLGKIKPRHTKDIPTSNWSVGGETMDRDYVEYESYKHYLGPLGAKLIRLQGGWAKCEKQKGVYSFEWLDHVIDDVISQGVLPWLQTSYGNPIYEGGGTINLGGGMPQSDEALEAWDNWVFELSKRYKDKVKVWEIWNEPDLHGKGNPIAYAKLYVRTAEIIRLNIPDAILYALAGSEISDYYFIEPFLMYIKEQGKFHLIDYTTFHGYQMNPDDAFPLLDKFKEVISKYSDKIKLKQGEQGCPSQFQELGALKKYHWTELTQTKWLLRRYLGDLGNDFPSTIFTMIDIRYSDHAQGPTKGMTYYGLIRAKEDKSFDYLKPSYFAMQNLTSIFDCSLSRIQNYDYQVKTERPVSLFAYTKKGSGLQLVSIWFKDKIPGDVNKTVPMSFTFQAGNFTDPVYVDMRTDGL
jgi:hypothetical protein